VPPLYFKPDGKELIRRVGRGRLERHTASRARSGAQDLLVAHVGGSRQEMGRQYGALVGDSVRKNADRLTGLFTAAGLPEPVALRFIDSSWERLAPHVPAPCIEEMEGIAAGASEAGFDLAIEDLQRILAVTNLDLYKREARIPEFLGEDFIEMLGDAGQQLLAALQGTPTLSCTMFAVWGSRTVDGKCFASRNLDWVSQTGMHEERLLTVYRPEDGHAFVSMGYAGVLGCLAGMNEKGISLSEVGAFSVREELDGIPWVLLARRVLEESKCLDDAVGIIQGAAHTIGYNYLVADGDPAHFGTKAFRPRAAAFETNYACCEVFFEDDPKEHDAVWADAAGQSHAYGLPLKEAVMRADTAFGAGPRALQATDNGPGAPANTGDPRGRQGERSTYLACHKPMHDMIRAYERGDAYVSPVRGTQVIEAGVPKRIGPEEAMKIAATVAHGEEMLAESDWDVMSVIYAPTDLDCWVAYESCDAGGVWRNAPDSGYWQYNLTELLEDSE